MVQCVARVLVSAGENKGKNSKKVSQFTNCWNTKQNNKGHHNQDIILGQTNELRWQHPKQLWGWHNACVISGELLLKWPQYLMGKVPKWITVVCMCLFFFKVEQFISKQGWVRSNVGFFCFRNKPRNTALPTAFLLYILRLWFCSITVLPGHIWLGTNGFIQYKKEKCRVSVLRFCFMFSITRSLFTVCSLLA